ncbi:MAG: pentapeptide repeat-containing protein [Candidatus Promineifilaceae bacterium]|nr:pentapeptide repeat-containing protein [Candidatus Promineifilaceae bacterium]
MAKRILVAYASGTGSTAEVAEAIGEVLREAAVPVEVHAAREVPSVEGYSAVVLGSSIRIGRWLPDAVQFLEKHQEALATRPAAYFTTCLTMASDAEDRQRIVMSYMEPVLRVAPGVEPVGLGLFAGSLSPGMQAIIPGEMPYGDFRDWEAIRGWAAQIRPQLLEGEVHERAPVVLTGVILSYTDMTGTDLSQVDLQHSALRESTLRRATLRGADMRHVDLTGSDLSQTDLSNAGLGWARLNEANLSRARLEKANAVGAELRGADLSYCEAQRIILNGANLTRAKLHQADLRRADLNWAVLTGADLSQADLRGANLGWADLSEANLDKAKLDKARYNEHTKWPEEFDAPAAGAIVVIGPH